MKQEHSMAKNIVFANERSHDAVELRVDELQNNLKILLEIEKKEKALTKLREQKLPEDDSGDSGGTSTTPELDEKTVKLREKLRQTVLKGTYDFEIEQLKILESEYYAHFEKTTESDKYFKDQRKQIRINADKEEKERLDTLEGYKRLMRNDSLQDDLEDVDILAKKMKEAGLDEIKIAEFVAMRKGEIIDEHNKEQNKLIKERDDELTKFKRLIRDNEKQNELDDLEIRRQEMDKAGIDEIALKQYVADQKAEIDKKYAESKLDKIKESAKSQLDQFKVVLDFGKKITSQLEKNLDSQVTNEIEALKKTDAYRNASSEQRKTMETQVNSKFAKERKKLFEYNKGVSMAEAMINIAEKIIEFSGNLPMQIAIGALGAIQLKQISAQQAPSYEQGGLVGGRRHSQGGTMIEAEKGEFVMSRSAVESIGVEAMNQINQGNGAGITVNVTAPLVDETVIDSIIPAIEKAQRLNLA